MEEWKNVAIILSTPPCDPASFIEYFSENTENLQSVDYIFRGGKVYIVANKDIVLKDTLVEYELATTSIPVVSEDTE
jgi:hypothetical protein